MAYTRRKTTRRTTGRKVARAPAARRSYRASGPARAAAPRGRSRAAARGSGSARTIRIVVETTPQNQVARPDMGLTAGPKLRTKRF